MKFVTKQYIVGESRIVKRFAWYPRSVVIISDDRRYYRDTRFWETVYIRQSQHWRFKYWRDDCFVTKEDYDNENANLSRAIARVLSSGK